MSNTDSEIPKFTLYGENTPAFDDSIQPTLGLRSWSDVPKEERVTALQQIVNSRWVKKEDEIVGAITHLNHAYLRLSPGRNLHSITERMNTHGIGYNHGTRTAAGEDFCRIFSEEAEPLVLRMLSKFAEGLIDKYPLGQAQKTVQSDERAKRVSEAFEVFDRFANCLNHIFEQFAINQVLTRIGFIPRQDETIDKELYKPTLKALSDPKWRPVNLTPMFEDFREVF